MGYMIKVFPLRASLLIFRLGLLPYSTFCLNLLGNRLVLIFFFTFIIPLSGKDFVALFFASVVQLLLHPESDDSAQLSQVL